MSEQVMSSTVDYVVAIIALLVPMGIGIFYAIKDVRRTTRVEYLLGGRKMSFFPVALSTFITYVSAISVIGVSTETFYFGGIIVSVYITTALSSIFGYCVFVPLLHPLNLTSVYEYIKCRYASHAVHVISTVIGMLRNALYQAVVLLSPALALQACFGLPLWVSITLLGFIGTLYTAIGGFKSVVWSDVFQAVVIFIGVFAIIIKACTEAGGIGEVWRLSEEGGRTRMDKFSLNPTVRHTQWSIGIGFFFISTSHFLSQATVQRISSMKSIREARRLVLTVASLQLLYGFIIVFMGLAIFAYYFYKKCGPYEGGFISNRNQIAPYFVLDTMGNIPGMTGLFIGTLCCGSLSTLSSGLNAMAANTVEDILWWPLRNLKEATIILITKFFVILYGCLAIGLAYLAQSLDGPVTQMTAAALGASGSPLLGILLLGASVPWANKYGALAGIAVSLSINLWISIGSVLQASPLTPLTSVTTENCPNASATFNSSQFQLSVTNTSFQFMQWNSTKENHNETNMPGFRDTFILYDITYEWYPVIG